MSKQNKKHVWVVAVIAKNVATGQIDEFCYRYDDSITSSSAYHQSIQSVALSGWSEGEHEITVRAPELERVKDENEIPIVFDYCECGCKSLNSQFGCWTVYNALVTDATKEKYVLMKGTCGRGTTVKRFEDYDDLLDFVREQILDDIEKQFPGFTLAKKQ